MKRYGTLRDCANEALGAMSNSHISSVTYCLIDSISFLKDQGLFDDEIQKHPIVRLYVIRLIALSELKNMMNDHDEAFRECEMLVDL